MSKLRFRHSAQTLGARKKQSGTILVIGLITILVITIIGIHSSRSSVMNLQMANNNQHIVVALAGAENSVVFGETRVFDLFAGPPTFDLDVDALDGFYSNGSIDMSALDWELPSGIEREFDVDGNLIAEYVIEYLSAIPGGGSLTVGTGGSSSTTHLYRISGRGTAPLGGERVVQTIFAVSN